MTLYTISGFQTPYFSAQNTADILENLPENANG